MLWKNSTRIISLKKKISLLNKANIYISNNDSFFMWFQGMANVKLFLTQILLSREGCNGLEWSAGWKWCHWALSLTKRSGNREAVQLWEGLQIRIRIWSDILYNFSDFTGSRFLQFTSLGPEYDLILYLENSRKYILKHNRDSNPGDSVISRLATHLQIMHKYL